MSSYKNNWNEMYELAKEYYLHYGNLIVNRNFKTINGYEYDENGKNLGGWISVQKTAYKNRSIPKENRHNKYKPLSDEQVEKLENIGMIFGKLSEYRWNEMYELAKEYYLHYGNLNINYSFKTINGYEYDENGKNLGFWINAQKTAYKNRSIPKEDRTNASYPLSDDQVEKLENIGMIFDKLSEYRWNEMYALAKAYYLHYGNLNINYNFKTTNGYEYNENGKNLGFWIKHQREAYLNRDIPKENRTNASYPLNDEQVEELENIGMIFGKLSEYRWNEMYALAKAYYLHYGNLNINYNFKTTNGYEYNENGKNLGFWIKHQREAYLNRDIPKENRTNNCKPLSDEQVEKLESIGMIFGKLSEYRWNEMYELAKEYYLFNGHLNVKSNFKTINGYERDKNGVNLGYWINYQRLLYQNRYILEEISDSLETLTDKQVEKLESIGMIFDIKSNQDKNRWLCIEYDFNYEDGMYLIDNMLHEEFSARINFLFANNLPLKVNGETNDIFFMSSSNLEAVYGLTREELITKYYKEYEKGNVKVRKR